MKKGINNTTLTKKCKSFKKMTSVIVTALMITAMATVTVFGATGTVDTTEFISREPLKTPYKKEKAA